LARAIRDGVKEDGSSLMGMPSESWVAVTDGDMADLLAWLRTHPPKGQARPGPRLGPMGRFLLIRKEVQPAPAWVAEAKAKPAMEAGPEFAVGRRIAQTVCSECHNSDLKGHPDTPDLLIGAAYDLPRFTRLMRTGIGMDDKEHGLMTEVAKGRFSHFTDQEIADLHAYLTARAEKTP
jgi:mono/diheme cytochrome c family protein